MAEMFDFNAERQKRGLPEVSGVSLEEFATNTVRDLEKDVPQRPADDTEKAPFEITGYSDKDLDFMLGNEQRNPGQYSRPFLFTVANEFLRRRAEKQQQRGI